MASGPVRITEPIKFGEDFELDLRAYELRRSGRALKLERIPMELLHLLVEQPGQLVTREQIFARIWGEKVCMDADNSINAAVRKIRQVLRDDSERPRFVQTITGRGYRFIAPVEIDTQLASRDTVVPSLAVSENPIAKKQAVAEQQAATGAGEPIRRPGIQTTRAPSMLQRWPVMLALALALILASGAYFKWSRSRAHTQAAGGKLMLAVLPFENLTGDPAQDYFSDSLTEEMIVQLGRLDPERLGVIARTSVMHYKHGQNSLDQIGRELGVQYVLEGSVRRDPDKVRINAQLIEVKGQTNLWARQYDRELSNLLALQGEIAQNVADEIQLTFGGRPGSSLAQQPPASAEAYELYLKGRYFWNKRTLQGFREAIDCFQQAIAKDPSYARAYAGLADSYALGAAYTLAPQGELIPKARSAALKALEIDDRLAEAHTSLAVIAQNYDWDWRTAEKEFLRAIELDPNYATAHHWYAENLAFQGRFDQAFTEMERARQLDPLSLIMAADNGAILYFSRQYDRAIKQFRTVLDMEPNFPRAHVVVWPYVETGRFAEALAHIEDWRRVDSKSPWIWALQAYVYGRSGDQVQARRALKKLEQLKRGARFDPVPFCIAHIGVGNKDQAIAWLEKAYAERYPSLTALNVDPVYDSLRSDPRFQDLVRRVGLAQ